MNERTARTARGNRIGLGLTGVLVAAGGGYLVARSLGAFGQVQAADPVYSSGTAEWFCRLLGSRHLFTDRAAGVSWRSGCGGTTSDR